MTATRAQPLPPAVDEPAWPGLAAVAVAVGCAALAARPLFVRPDLHPALAAAGLFGALWALGAGWPTRERATPRATWGTAAVVALGLAGFAAGRLIGGGHAPQPAALRLIALNALAAVGEEALFRRLAYAVLAPRGAAAAVVGSALLFAVVHLSVYGAWVLPLDLAAGLLLSWQRWASGDWRAPALTHALANVLVVI